MNRYTIYCTEEQTKIALELGYQFNIVDNNIIGNIHKSETDLYAEIPTTEQMIGWLEGQGGIKEITVCKTGMWIWGKNHTLIDGGSRYSSRQKSSLAAIDAALEYLITCKNEK